MVSTIKFSQFTNTDLTNSSNTLVGFGGGVNIQQGEPITWTTLTRPSPPFNGLLGFNTDLSQYEYWDTPTGAWLQLLTSTSGESWSEITSVSFNANVNSGYITNRTVTPVSILLPSVCNLGDSVEIMGKGAGKWSLVANAGQTIIYGNYTSTGFASKSYYTLNAKTVLLTILT